MQKKKIKMFEFTDIRIINGTQLVGWHERAITRIGQLAICYERETSDKKVTWYKNERSNVGEE